MDYTKEMIDELISLSKNPLKMARTAGINVHNKALFEEMMTSTNGIIQNNDWDTTAIYLAWYAFYNHDKNIMIGMPKHVMAKDMIERIKQIHAALPSYITPQIRYQNKTLIEFDNGCKVIGSAVTEGFCKGRSINVIYLHDYQSVRKEIREYLGFLWYYPFLK